MRLLVCGGREFDDWKLLSDSIWSVLESHDMVHQGVFETKEVELVIIQGGAKGADFLARVWAKLWGIKMIEYPADWNKYKGGAGPIRNKQMLVEGKPDLVIAFRGGNGTANMIKQAKGAGVPVEIVK